MMDDSKIKTFYKNQTVFITGGTGFLGKILVEKLLRVCELEKIYILVRPKKGKTTEQRFDDFFSYACFDRLKSQEVDLKSKVRFIHGDCEKPNLGLSKEHEDVLIDETTTVIHAAANVKFDQPLQTAARINVRSTEEVFRLAKQMPKLKAFIYVSTAYANCPHFQIDETFYDPPMTSKQLLNIVEGMDEELLERITPKLLGKWPNTYTFTKCISEDIVKKEAQNLPVAIVRPAIVITTIQEPMPGWIDNFYGIIGIVMGAALGVLRSLHAKLDNIAYVVPCDYACNTVLAAAWSVHEEKPSTVPIYNYVASYSNTITWRRFMQGIEDCAWDYPTEKLIWYYNFKVRENAIWHKICIFFLHTVVAHIVDFVLFCVGREPLAVKNYDRINKLLKLTSYFSINNWTFTTKNVERLWSKMGESDRELFMFNMDKIQWEAYAANSVVGGRIHLLKDPLETIPQGRKKLQIIRIAHFSILTVLAVLLFYLVKLILSFIF